MAIDKESIEAQLAAVKQGFVEQLPTRMRAIVDSQMAWLKNTADSSALEEFHRLVHSLTGSSATFGLSQVSADSRELEQHLKTLKEKPSHSESDISETKRLLKIILINAASPS